MNAVSGVGATAVECHGRDQASSGRRRKWVMSVVGALVVALVGISTLSSALRASIVVETPTGIELRVEVPAGLDPDSISLELAGSRITVMAHDRAGKLVGSRVVRVRDAVDEEGATVVYERDGSLTIRLRKTPTLRGSFEDRNAARTFVSAATNRLGPDHTSLGGARTLPTASAA